MGLTKETGLFHEATGDPLNNFKQGCDIIQSHFRKRMN